jgi:hypothetical protein
MATRTITRSEFAQINRNDYAGTVRELSESTVKLYRAAAPDWDGEYWAMTYEVGVGTTVGPVNVR